MSNLPEAATFNPLLAPTRLWTREEVLARPSAVPKERGVYAWYFREIPPDVPTAGCVRQGSLTLLYVGIAPKPPPRNGKPPSTQRLFHRIRYHYRGNAAGSTLRLTLGCLLARPLGIELRRVGSGERMTFGAGEALLSEWMGQNAFVTWLVHPEPWIIEEQLVSNVPLPLNLDMNAAHPFHDTLAALRRGARERARERPVVPRSELSRGP